MSEQKIKHLATWIAWVLIHIYILAFRFTLYSLALLAVAAVYLLITTVYSKKHEDRYLYETMGNLLGTSLFVFLGWSAITGILPEILTNVDRMETFWEAKLSVLLNNALAIFSYDAMSLALFGTVIVFVIQRIVGKTTMLKMLFSYVYNVLWVGSVLEVVYESKELGFMCVVLACIFAFVEAWAIKASGSRAQNGKRWLNVLTVLLFIMICWDSEFLVPFTQEGYLEYFFIISSAKWYHLLFALLILGALAYIYGDVTVTDDDRRDMIDIRYPVRGICMILVVFFMNKFHVGYWWILMLIAIIYEIIDMLFIFPQDDDEDRMFTGVFAEIGIALALIVLTIAGHYGRFVMTLAILGGIVAIWFVLATVFGETRETKWNHIGWMYTAVIAVISVIAAISLWFYRNLGYNFWLLLTLSIVSIGVLWLLSYNGSVSRSLWNIPQLVVLGVFVICVGCLCFSHGSTIRFIQNNQQISAVEVEAKGEGNNSVSLEYYWTDDWLIRENATTDIPEEKEISGINQIPDGDGKLRVVSTDLHGIVTEEIFWVHVAPDYSNAS